jgi:hypothetical protein
MIVQIAGKMFALIDSVTIKEQVSHVVFTPDGTRAIATKSPCHKHAFLDVKGE